MQHTASEVIETIKTLPTREKDKVFDWVEAEKRQTAEKTRKREMVEEQLERFRKAQEWILANREKYMNQWVCLDGDRLIAHGTDGLEVHRKAKEAGIEAPYLEQIVEEDDWGGW